LVEWQPTRSAKEVSIEGRAPREWISVAEVQEILGIGRTKAYELAASGEVEAARIGRAVRIKRASLEAYTERIRYAQGWR
jgi:excisionase family DNA binding protein